VRGCPTVLLHATRHLSSWHRLQTASASKSPSMAILRQHHIPHTHNLQLLRRPSPNLGSRDSRHSQQCPMHRRECPQEQRAEEGLALVADSRISGGVVGMATVVARVEDSKHSGRVARVPGKVISSSLMLDERTETPPRRGPNLAQTLHCSRAPTAEREGAPSWTCFKQCGVLAAQ